MRLVDAGRDGPVSPLDGKEVALHLRGCARCAREKARGDRLEDALVGMPAPRTTRSRLGETVRAVREEVRGRGGRTSVGPGGRRGLAIAVGVAASIVAAAGIGVLTLGRREPSGGDVSPDRRVAVPEGETVRAPDRAAVRRGGGMETSKEEELAGSPARERADVLSGSAADRGDPLDDLVEKLVRADLDLSEATGSGRKAVIFSAMSREVLSELRGLIGRADPAVVTAGLRSGAESPGEEATRALGLGYAKLVREGVLANVRLAGAPEDRESLSQVIDSLRRDGEVLRVLVSRTRGEGRGLLAEALAASEECRDAAEGVMGF